jgi:cell division septation protein DedD
VSAAEAEPPPPLVPLSELATAPPVAAAPSIAPSPALAPAAVEVRAAVQPQGAVVQVASYVERKPADELVVKLKDSGFDAYVSQPAAANGRYRVRIRPTAKESAGDLAKRLRGFGFDTWATSE